MLSRRSVVLNSDSVFTTCRRERLQSFVIIYFFIFFCTFVSMQVAAKAFRDGLRSIDRL